VAKLKEVLDGIRAIAPRISSEPLRGAHYAPEGAASPTQCFSNAQRKAQQAGGGVLYGWMFQLREVAALLGRFYLIAMNHAVWHAPDNTPLLRSCSITVSQIPAWHG
jgi:hypothetical protein